MISAITVQCRRQRKRERKKDKEKQTGKQVTTNQSPVKENNKNIRLRIKVGISEEEYLSYNLKKEELVRQRVFQYNGKPLKAMRKMT